MTQISKMQDKADAFAKTLNMEDFQAVQESLTQLQKKHINAKEAIVNFDLVESMREGFTEFPQMRNNEYVEDQLNYLEGAQDNLNNNPANNKLALRLVEVTNEVTANLQSEYGSMWTNPIKK